MRRKWTKAFRRRYMKEYHKEYSQSPEVKERKRKYNREYQQIPEVKERMRKYNREYQQRPEAKLRRVRRFREHNLKLFIEKGKSTEPQSLFTSPMIRELALDGAEFDKLYKRIWGKRMRK